MLKKLSSSPQVAVLALQANITRRNAGRARMYLFHSCIGSKPMTWEVLNNRSMSMKQQQQQHSAVAHHLIVARRQYWRVSLSTGACDARAQLQQCQSTMTYLADVYNDVADEGGQCDAAVGVQCEVL